MDRLLAAAGRLLRFERRWPRRGRWRTPTGEAWQPAVALEAVALAARHDPSLTAVLDRAFHRYRGRRSSFFDDDLWYLNTWLTCFELTGELRYQVEAVALFDRALTGWDTWCGGGMWWNTSRRYKNAITTELLLLAAARLAPVDYFYAAWAKRVWSWLRDSGLVNEVGLVNDGLTRECANNGGAPWTYNQGVVLGGLALLGELEPAHAIATAAIAHLTGPDGILREPAPPGRDGHAFKGIFALGLARLAAVSPRPAYERFLRANADAVWARRRPDDGIALDWHTGAGPVNAATHASGTLLLTAAE